MQLQTEKGAAETVRTVAESREKAVIAQMESAQRTTADQEREMQAQLREADKENAKLAALVEQYQAQLASLIGKSVDARHEVAEGDNT